MIRLLRLLFPAGREARGRAERRLIVLVLATLLLCGGLTAGLAARRAARALLPALPPAQANIPAVATEAVQPPPPTPDVAPDRPVTRALLAPAVAFTAPEAEITLAELRARWEGTGAGPLVVTEETAAALASQWGPAGAAVQRVAREEDAIAALWNDPASVALVRFDRLLPAVRALPLDGQSLLDPSVPNDAWPLVLDLGDATSGDGEPVWNRLPDALGSVIVTGVTAMTRSVYTTMVRHGDMAYPAHQIASVTAAADLMHVSNEVSFQQGCVPDDFVTAFCADPAAMATLQELGVDIVELTGNHNNDVGADAALASLELYRQANLLTFGGGGDAESAARPALATVRGTAIAFLGYNQFGPEYAWAGEASPGANRWPAENLDQLRTDILAARDAGAALVFVHVQHTESYQVPPLTTQIADFRAAVDAGADVVVGTQAHTPQAIEFYRGRPIFYGLGNLIFDQMQSLATREGLIVRYTVMEGKLLQAELLTTIIEEYAQPRFTTPEERAALLTRVFADSSRTAP